MSEFCLLAASLLSQGQIPDWQLSTPAQPIDPPATEATKLQRHCQPVAAKGAIAHVEIQRPEFSPQPPPADRSLADRSPKSSVSAAPADRQHQLPVPLELSSIGFRLPGLETSGQAHLPNLVAAVVRPLTGGQLYQQRRVALRAGRVYTRLPVSSYEQFWLNATMQPTYEQWVELLTAEAGAIARGQGSNRLTVLVGDSLYLWYPQEQLAGDRFWLNQGISGDTTTGVLQRLSAFSQARPDRIRVMVGINDLRRGATDEQVLSNLRQIMRQLQHSHPTAQIFVQSILPTRLVAIPASRIAGINDRLAAIAQQEGVNFVDLQSHFADTSGDLDSSLTTDGLHLNPQGYAVWQMALHQADPAL
jgi:lysophospholipase L1-like esterase